MRATLLENVKAGQALPAKVLTHPTFKRNPPDYKIQLFLNSRINGNARYILSFYVRVVGANDPSHLSTALRECEFRKGCKFVDGKHLPEIKAVMLYASEEVFGNVSARLRALFAEHDVYDAVAFDHFVQYSKSEDGRLF
ncbi:MAG: hypothetical protein QNJ16_11075 [Rhodobacter sp.]|nr:hypothetical protein [Rhodobacter sp.]